ncbi:TPA: hypothetical protein KH785_005529, partial [Escherichia coli]|nr:hypothetical protein [Escherichia coli]
KEKRVKKTSSRKEPLPNPSLFRKKIKYSGTRIRNSARNNAGTRSPLDISSCLFVRNAGIKVIENDKVNIEKQPTDDCFFIVAFLFFVISIYIPLLVV